MYPANDHIKVIEELRLVSGGPNQWSKVDRTWHLGTRGHEFGGLATAMISGFSFFCYHGVGAKAYL